MPRVKRDYTDVLLVRIAPDVHEELRRICRNFPQRSVSEFVREAIRTQMRLERQITSGQALSESSNTKQTEGSTCDT